MPFPNDPTKIRSVFLIDGFNLYHAIDDCPQFHGHKWLDPMKLARVYAPKEAIIAVFFFTALPPWDAFKRTRHQRLLDVYADLGVIIRPGLFKPTQATCRLCGKTYDTYAEKLTDIHICLELLRMGEEDLADRVYLVTGDNDQAASVRAFRAKFPEKQVVLITPPFRKAAELQSVTNTDRGMTVVQLQKSLLPDPYKFKDGRVYPKPQNWVEHPVTPAWKPCEHR